MGATGRRSGIAIADLVVSVSLVASILGAATLLMRSAFQNHSNSTRFLMEQRVLDSLHRQLQRDIQQAATLSAQGDQLNLEILPDRTAQQATDDGADIPTGAPERSRTVVVYEVAAEGVVVRQSSVQPEREWQLKRDVDIRFAILQAAGANGGPGRPAGVDSASEAPDLAAGNLESADGEESAARAGPVLVEVVSTYGDGLGQQKGFEWIFCKSSMSPAQ